MKQITPNLALATGILISNVWLLRDNDGRAFLFDTGHGLERLALWLFLWRAGIRQPGDLTALILTHRHSDHAGNSAWIREKFRCPVICHEEDAIHLSGAVTPPKMVRDSVRNPFSRLLCHVEDTFPARCVVDETFSEGSWQWGFRVYPTPGHTMGSSMLYHEATETTFSGDAILAGPPLPMRPLVFPYLAVPEYSADVERCRTAAREFIREMPPTDTLCSGHGPALTGETVNRIRSLA